MILTATPPYPVLMTMHLRTHYHWLRKHHFPHKPLPAGVAASVPAVTRIPAATTQATVSQLELRPHWLIALLARRKVRKAIEDTGVEDHLEVCQLLPVLDEVLG
jgi:hypothetical protein